MNRKLLICLVVALAAAITVVVLSSRSARTEDNESTVADLRQHRATPVPVHKANAQPGSRPQRPKPVISIEDDDEEDTRTPAEKDLAERIEKALDEEDVELAIACVDEAQKCSVVEIRQAMVDTLGWFGEKTLPELTPFLADADEDVRESAKNEWMMALSDIEDDKMKIRAVELAMGVLDDEDTLEDISGEFIGVDEKLAVESIVRIVTEGKSAAGVEKAKEAYEFVTGDEWTDAAEAERWIAEEYEPPEES